MANRYEQVSILYQEVIRLTNENKYIRANLNNWENIALLAAKLTVIAEDKLESYKQLTDIYKNERDVLFDICIQNNIIK